MHATIFDDAGELVARIPLVARDFAKGSQGYQATATLALPNGRHSVNVLLTRIGSGNEPEAAQRALLVAEMKAAKLDEQARKTREAAEKLALRAGLTVVDGKPKAGPTINGNPTPAYTPPTATAKAAPVKAPTLAQTRKG